MSDTSEGDDATTGAAASPPLVVKAQYTKDLSFEHPNAPGSIQRLRRTPDVNINVNADAKQIEGRDYEVELTIRGEAKNGEELLFITEVVYAGLFAVGEQVSEDNIKPLLLIECPRLLFPFARDIIATVTRDGGLPPLMLQPIDFVALYRQRYAKQEDAPGPVGHA